MDEKLITIKQLQKEIGRSRATVYNYLKDGMPHIRKGNKNYFKLSDVQTWLIRYKSGEEYHDIASEAQEKYPDDPLGQIKHIRQYGNHRQYAMSLAEVAQQICSSTQVDRSIKIYCEIDKLDLFFRGLLQALRKVPESASGEVFRYIGSRIDYFTIDIIKQIKSYQYVIKEFITFFEQTRETEKSFDERRIDYGHEEHDEFFKKRGSAV